MGLRISRRSLLTAGLAVSLPPVAGAQTRPSSISIEKDIFFAKAGAMDLRLDIYHPPKGKEKRMATIHFHGGGFTGGSKETLAARVSPLAELGYTPIVSQYRLAGQAKWPSQLEDVQSAIQWVRANVQRLNIEPNRVAVVGYSAGGFLALSAAAAAVQGGSPLAACVGYYPVSELRTGSDGRAHPLMPDGSSEASHRAASPTTSIGAGFPPTILFQGTADTTVRLDSTQKLFEQMRTAGVRAELHSFEGQPHIFDNQPVFADACARLVDLFLDRIAVNPQ